MLVCFVKRGTVFQFFFVSVTATASDSYHGVLEIYNPESVNEIKRKPEYEYFIFSAFLNLFYSLLFVYLTMI